MGALRFTGKNKKGTALESKLSRQAVRETVSGIETLFQDKPFEFKLLKCTIVIGTGHGFCHIKGKMIEEFYVYGIEVKWMQKVRITKPHEDFSTT